MDLDHDPGGHPGVRLHLLCRNADIYTYLVQRETFSSIATWGNGVYVVAAHWELRRGRAISARAHAEAERETTSHVLTG